MGDEELWGWLRAAREAAKRYDHLAINARAGRKGDNVRVELRCNDCDFEIVAEAGALAEVLDRIGLALRFHAEGRGGNCKFATHARKRERAKRQPTPTPNFSEGVRGLMASGLLEIDVAARTVKIIIPPLPPQVEAERGNIQQAMQFFKRELEGQGFTVTIEER